MLNKTYDELLKEKEYEQIAHILLNNNDCRADNRKLIKRFYNDIYGLTIDEAFDRNDLPNYQSIERKARLLKAKNKELRFDKSEQVDIYREIATETPVAIRLF